MTYTYRKGYHSLIKKRDPILEKAALDAAEEADTVLFFGGLTDFEECEGYDRSDMLLPENQRALISELCASGKKTVLVLFAGSPVGLPFIDGLSAVLDMHLPGMLGGEAAARLIFGETSPSGRLAESWPVCETDSPSAPGFNKGEVSVYSESIYVGYRFYDKSKVKPLFPFGYGLGYEPFEWSEPELSVNDGEVTVSLDVRNAGKSFAADVVELYVKNAESAVFKPEKELRAYKKVRLSAGKKTRVTLCFAVSDISFWDVSSHSFVCEDGDYSVLISRSAGQAVFVLPLKLTGFGKASQTCTDEISAAYAMPPEGVIPDCFYSMCGCERPSGEPLPLGIESPLSDFKRTASGRMLYALCFGWLRRGLKKANKIPDPVERGARLKNIHFILRSLPNNCLRSLAMSSGGTFSYNAALGLAAFASGRHLAGIRLMLRREKRRIK